MSDKSKYPIIWHAKSGVRIVPNTGLAIESVLETKPHPIDDTPMLKSMRHRLRLLYLKRMKGDRKAENTLFEIHQLLYPEAHALPEPIERGLDVRYLMCEISYLATPKNSDSGTILSGPITLSANASVFNPDLYNEVTAQWKKAVTLQSLANRIFVERLHRRGIYTIDEKKLQSDLKRLREWDKKPSGGKSPNASLILFSTDEELPFEFRAHRWLKRKRFRSESPLKEL